ncbi:absent in melanoma 1 protein, partial [Sigmodon hispidus]
GGAQQHTGKGRRASDQVISSTAAGARGGEHLSSQQKSNEMPLSPPSQGAPREASPSKAPKKHSTFHIWRSKKKQSPPSSCGVFLPHPPGGLGETG